MLTAQQVKLIKSLQNKKFRFESGLFVAEGEKLVNDLLNGNLSFRTVYHTSEWVIPAGVRNRNYQQVSPKEMERISSLVNPSTVLAVIEYPNYEVKHSELLESLTLVLDDIQDPGNLGTIIRLADWFGIDTIVCSQGTADAFSPKVVQASMGAISRVKVAYCNLPDFFREFNGTFPVYGTFIDGIDIYATSLNPTGLIVMGNEGSGISREVERFISSKLRIPNFAKNRESVESLNVAMATAIICSEFRRR